MPCLCVIGWSNSGKTTLLARLLPELRALGLRVLVIKHSGHAHPPHKPGSDTERLQTAGAEAVGFATPDAVQLTFPGDAAAALSWLLPALGARVDLVLVEGWKDGPFPKLEVWRGSLGPSLSLGRPDVLAYVTDDVPPRPLPCFRTDEAPRLARFLLQWARPG